MHGHCACELDFGVLLVNGETPYDRIWSWVAGTTIAVGVASFLILSTGEPSLFPSAEVLVQDDAKVTVAFWGALISAGGLAALGGLALLFLRFEHCCGGPPWPRFTPLETELRSPIVATIALTVVCVVPVAALVACLSRYVSESRVAEWNSHVALAPGFLSSRLVAFQHHCSDQPCFRFMPKGDVEPFAQQWSVLSDGMLVAALTCALICWSLFAKSACRQWMSNRK